MSQKPELPKTDDDNLDIYCILYPEHLTAESRKLLEDADLALIEVYLYFLKYEAYREKVKNEGISYSSKEATLCLSRIFAGFAIVSFELFEHGNVAFPVNATPVTVSDTEGNELSFPLINMHICTPEGTAKEAMFEAAVFAVEQYTRLRELAEKFK